MPEVILKQVRHAPVWDRPPSLFGMVERARIPGSFREAIEGVCVVSRPAGGRRAVPASAERGIRER